MPITELSRIDRDMGVQSSPALLKSGKPSSDKRKQFSEINFPDGAPTVADMIVVASLHPGSNFNNRTGGVFARQMPVGFSRAYGKENGKAMFWAWIREHAEVMIKARHSSSGFYAAIARAVNIGFGISLGRVNGIKLPNADGNQNSGADVNKASTLLSKGLAKVYPARGTGPIANASFSVSTTEPDTKGIPANVGLDRMSVVWQAAVDSEAKDIEAYAASLYVQMARQAGILVP